MQKKKQEVEVGLPIESNVMMIKLRIATLKTTNPSSSKRSTKNFFEGICALIHICCLELTARCALLYELYRICHILITKSIISSVNVLPNNRLPQEEGDTEKLRSGHTNTFCKVREVLRESSLLI